MERKAAREEDLGFVRFDAEIQRAADVLATVSVAR